MDKEFFERKVRELSDDKLQDLLKLRYEANREIVDMAIGEARKRGLNLPEVRFPADKVVNVEEEDRKKLEKWNWAGSLLDVFEQIGEMGDTNFHSRREPGCGDLSRVEWKQIGL